MAVQPRRDAPRRRRTRSAVGVAAVGDRHRLRRCGGPGTACGPGPSVACDRRAGSALDLGPGLDPVVEALALHVRPAVDALGGRASASTRRPSRRRRRRRGRSSQWSGSAVSAHDFELPGASPNHSAIWAFVSGEVEVVDERVGAGEVLGLGVDHPGVGPAGRALGRLDDVDRDGGSSPWSRLVMICQVVPTFDVAGRGSRPSA